MSETKNKILTEIDENQLEYEKTLLDLFGYKIIQVTPTICTINDENDKSIGFIQLVTRNNNNTEQQYYKTKFVKDGVFFSNLRDLADETKKYKFIMRKNGEIYTFKLSLDKYYSALAIFNRNIEKLRITKRQVELIYTFENSQTKNYLCETSSIYSSDISTKQSYYWNLSDKPTLYRGNDETAASLEVNKGGNYPKTTFRVSLTKNGCATQTPNTELNNTTDFEELLSNCENSLQSFSRFREKYEILSPFKEDLISLISQTTYEQTPDTLTPIIDMMLEKSSKKQLSEDSKVLKRVYQVFQI